MQGALKWMVLLMLAGLAGCSTTPPTSIHQPMTAKPEAAHIVATNDGGIFHAGVNERPLFEDKRARNIGDILTINLIEKTTGNKQSSDGSTSSGAVNSSTPSITKKAIAIFNPFTVAGTSSNKTATSSSGAASEDLTGSITVTVTEVLANGYLLVSGEKQVALNQSDDFIRFSGVVNPTSISNLNVVQSTQVADAHIEYKSAGAMSEVVNDTKTMGFLGRFFKSVMPF